MLRALLKVGFTFVSILSFSSVACTAFLLQGEQGKFVGKSYDWHHEEALLITNKSGMAKKGFSPVFWEKGPKWISKFGSITFNQYGREFPNGGMNEAGLVVEVLWLKSSEYEAFDNRPVLNQLTWVQYQLDNFSSVAEVIKALPKHRLSPIQGKIHYFVCDKTANCAVIEWQKGKPVVHSGKELNPSAITNDTYQESLAEFQRLERESVSAAADESSLSRFVRVAKLLNETEASYENAFNVLKSVEMKNLTTWNIVYDLENSTIYYRTRKNPDIRNVRLNAQHFSCSSSVLSLNINEGKGNADNLWVGFSHEKNEKLIEDGLSDVNFSWVLVPLLSGYPDTTSCQQSRISD